MISPNKCVLLGSLVESSWKLDRAVPLFSSGCTVRTDIIGSSPSGRLTLNDAGIQPQAKDSFRQL